jgi:hypothetical protein
MLVGLHKWLDFAAYWWHELTTSRYVRYLERENRRLQEQNLALWNSVWGVRGMPGHVQGPTTHLTAPSGAPADMPMGVRQAVGKLQDEMRAVPKNTPGVVRSKTRPSKREAELEALNKTRTEQGDKIRELREELNGEIERERRERTGEGYAVIGDGKTPVAIVEPPDDEVTLIDEPEPQVVQDADAR